MQKPQAVTAIIVAAGSGKRVGGSVAKQFLEIDRKPILRHTLDVFQECARIDRIIVVAPADLCQRLHQAITTGWGISKVDLVVPGGSERHDSVWNALQQVATNCTIVVIHDGVRPFVTVSQIEACIASAEVHGAATLATPPKDTIKVIADNVVKTTPDRSSLVAVQTPQAFYTEVILRAYQNAILTGEFSTDDAALVEKIGQSVHIVMGDYQNIKITSREDVLLATAMLGHSPQFQIGQGYDVHRLVSGRPLILGGVQIPFELGLLGHSDADVLCHAISDALLGAAALGDIGLHFPDSDSQYQGISSLILLKKVWEMLQLQRWRIRNIDATLIAQRPKIAPFRLEMRKNIAHSLDLALESVSIKATTTEGLGFAGREEGIAAQAICLLQRNGD